MLKDNHADRIRIAKRIARELQKGTVVNLGVGIPTLIPDYLEPNQEVFLQSENGLLGMSSDDLTAQLRQGKSLAQIAQEKGISTDDIRRHAQTFSDGASCPQSLHDRLG